MNVARRAIRRLRHARSSTPAAPAPVDPTTDDPAESFVEAKRRKRPFAVIVLLVAGIVGCWMLLMPPGAGPDEHGHLIRSGAVIRGDFGNSGSYQLPDSYRVPEPGCYAFDPTISAECTASPVRTGATVTFVSRAGDYPIWAHGVYGLASLAPGFAPLWWARAAGALFAAGLVGWALRATLVTRPLAATALLVGVTPMAWSVFATINPSSFVTAGAVALWAGLLSPGGETRVRNDWLVAVGWAALALPRRDGLMWACITLAIALAATDRSAIEWWRSMALSARVLIGISTLVTVAWGLTSDSRTNQMVAVAPLIVVMAELTRRWTTHPELTRRTKQIGLGAATALGLTALVLLLSRRPGGWDTNLAVDVVGQTDENLIEAIGVLGWLDTLVPWFVVFTWLVVIGVLVAVALSSGLRTVGWAGLLAAITALTSWVFELYQGNSSGTYWQGRYSIPLLIGIPMLLTLDTTKIAATAGDFLRRVDRFAGAGALLILNVAAWATARRFGVGTSGSHLPWRWGLEIQPIHPMLLLIIHAVLTIALLIVLVEARPTSADAVAR